jgi:membrane protein implicated in regulation of membrane protease activity
MLDEGKGVDMTTMFWIWMAAVIVFLILELMTPTLVYACFTAGSLAAGVYSYFSPHSYYWQFGLFVAVSLVLLPLTRPIAKKITRPSRKSNVDALIGKVALVTKAIDANLGGQVRIEGEVWWAQAGEDIAENTKVKIVGVSGTKLHVERIEQAKEES